MAIFVVQLAIPVVRDNPLSNGFPTSSYPCTCVYVTAIQACYIEGVVIRGYCSNHPQPMEFTEQEEETRVSRPGEEPVLPLITAGNLKPATMYNVGGKICAFPNRVQPPPSPALRVDMVTSSKGAQAGVLN